MLRIFKKCGKYWYLPLFLFLLILVQTVSDIGLPTVMGDVIKLIQGANGSQPEYTDYLIWGCVLILAFAFLSALSAFLIGLCTSKLVSKILTDVRQELYEHIDKFSMAEMNRFSTSSLLTRVTNDFTNINLTLNLGFRYVIYGPLVAIIAVVLMLTKNPARPAWELMLVVAGALAIILVLVFLIVKFVLSKMNEIQKRTDHLTLVTRESLEGLRVIRAYNAEGYQEEKYGRINDGLSELQVFTNKMLAVFNPAVTFIGGALSLVVAWIGSTLIEQNAIEFSDITVYT
ncbi:MAG: ABC transporter ATP-binding protein, partial [Bacilli bacterium]|nr:ABC transporter ATP-binding protein [Bacilli bacterium]